MAGKFLKMMKNFFIQKEFKFKNYVRSEKFVFEVGKIAEEEGHHPDILLWICKNKNFNTCN